MKKILIEINLGITSPTCIFDNRDAFYSANEKVGARKYGYTSTVPERMIRRKRTYTTPMSQIDPKSKSAIQRH
jgi:hypothetical protein